jgi:hypothetical protein
VPLKSVEVFGEDRGEMSAGMARRSDEATTTDKRCLRGLASMREGNAWLVGEAITVTAFAA